MFHIEWDSCNRTFNVKMAGFWDDATSDAFEKQLALIGTQQTDFNILCDCVDFPPQGVPVLESLRKAMHERKAIKVAIVVGSMLAKLQAQRNVGMEKVSVFLSLDDAKAWLTAKDNSSS